MPALYPPSLPSLTCSAESPGFGALGATERRLFLGVNIVAPFACCGVVVDLEPGLAEAVDLGGLPRDNRDDGADHEPASVQPCGGSQHEEHHREADHLDKVAGNEQAD